MTVTFDRDYRWDGDRYGMVFPAHVDGMRVLCLISGEALQDHFDAGDRHESMEEAFLRNRKIIEDIARALIESGRVDQTGKILIRGADVAACA
jgi:hypothetical protein